MKISTEAKLYFTLIHHPHSIVVQTMKAQIRLCIMQAFLGLCSPLSGKCQKVSKRLSGAYLRVRKLRMCVQFDVASSYSITCLKLDKNKT